MAQGPDKATNHDGNFVSDVTFSIPCPWLCLAAMLVSFLDMVMACWHPAISQPCVGAVHRHPVHSAGDIKKRKK